MTGNDSKNSNSSSSSDNTQELDEILERYRLHANMAYSEVEDNFRTAEEFKTLALPKVLAEANQALLDWHNKQVEEAITKKLYELDEAGNQYSKKTDYNAGAAHVGDLVKTQIAELKGEKAR